MRTRPNSFSNRGVVASSSQYASAVGARILERRGNVFDAALATSAVLAVTQNNLCGLGGDMFALLRTEGEGIININGSGRASSKANIEIFKEKGISSLPSRGPDSALTVPGLVSGWMEIYKKCTFDLRELLLPAFTFASEGFAVTHNYSESIEISAKYLAPYQEWRNAFYIGGRAPSPGTLFKQKALAKTLKLIIDDGLDSFYTGYVADRIVKGLEGSGVLLSQDDFRNHKATVEKPLSTDFFGHKLYETAPNSQGATVILWANAVEEFYNEFGRIPNDIEIIKLGLASYEERDRRIADPQYHKLPDYFLSKDFARKLLQKEVSLPGDGGGKDIGDTTYFAISDNEGNSVSMIQSNYMGFGSGIMPIGMGFVLQNRGSYFTLDEKHHNSLEPNKRTFHTLCAAMLEKEGRFEASFGSMGGDIQPQIHIQILTNLLEKLNDPQSILDRPRWAFPYTIYEKPSEIICESQDLEKSISREIRGLKCSGRTLSSEFGHAQIVTLLQEGVIVGGADPRGDGVAEPALPN
ncbi:MAG: gamma-glutamyltransferase family protein [Thermoplasmatales archaeon]